jgi:hypothetical protein
LIILAHFFAASPQKTGLSAAIFFADAAKKDFRYNPGRMGEQQFCFAKLRPAPCAPRATCASRNTIPQKAPGAFWRFTYKKAAL